MTRDLATDLRAAEQVLADAEVRLAGARESVDSASRAYDARRRYSPGGMQTERARTAWGLALNEWAQALVAREQAKDAFRAERKSVDQAVVDAVFTTEQPLIYDAYTPTVGEDLP